MARIGFEPEKIVVEGGVDDAVGRFSAAPEAVGVFHIAPVDLRPRSSQRLG